MPVDLFECKKFTIKQDKCAMKVGTDAILLGGWAELPAIGRVLDIGTGTGILALMAAQRSPETSIDAIEMDELAYVQAKENCHKSPWNSRINVIHSTFQDFRENNKIKYDSILCNPPYFSNSLPSPSEARTMARHSQTLPFEELASGVAALLQPEGVFSTILPPKETEQLSDFCKARGLQLFKEAKVKTTSLKEVKRIMMQFGFTASSFSESNFAIENSDHSFTNEYRKLAEGFLLHF